jgi:enoyl-CoA hydratase/carnithine racemase
MGPSEASVGVLPGGCGTQNLPWLVGEGWAKRMMLTNERVSAETAMRIGLIAQVVPVGHALETALSLSQRVARQSPWAVLYGKELIHQARKGTARHASLAFRK